MPDAATKSDRVLARAGEQAVALALKAGAQQADALIEASSEFRVNVHGRAIEQLKQSRSRGLGLRVFADQKLGFVYTSDLRADALQDLARRAVNLARTSTADEFNGLPALEPTAERAEALRLFDPAVPELSPEKKIGWAKELEKEALAYDKRIVRTDGCTVVTQMGETHLASSEGPPTMYRGTAIALFVNPLADDGPRQQSGFYGEQQRFLAQLGSPREVAREAARRAVDRIGARPVPTQKLPVVMHPDIAGNWVQNLFSAFSGEKVFKKTSYLTEKLGQPIASELVTIVDDGVLPSGLSTSPFDGEGLPTRRNVLIEKGVCRMFVYDSYWARKAKTQSTGNAGRAYGSTPFIGNKNLYLAAGASTPEQILASCDKGFYMVDSGSFGYNETTGAYSYQAAGFWIEKGELGHPIQEVTIASTSLDMLKNIVMVGNDLKFNGSVNAPTIKIAEMTLSGRTSDQS